MTRSQDSSHEGQELRVVNVNKEFTMPDHAEIRVLALQSINVTVAAGELVSIVGPSGGGKSTLLRLIAGLDSPRSGEIWIGDERITAPSAERGLVFQDPNLFPWLTVRRNIESGLVARGLIRQKRSEVDDFMRLVGLEAFGNLYPHHLSGGMAQRVALARALINHPKLLLLDEPLGALDSFTRMRLQDEVLRLWESRGTTMLLVTHDIDEAIYMSDRILIMSSQPGRIERTITVPFERPRKRTDPEFLSLRAEILELLHFAGKTGTAQKVSISTQRRVSEKKSPDTSFGTLRKRSPDALDADVIIIGGGPAGATLGAYLSRAEVDHLILDQAVHPRPHIGESLVCSTTRIFQEINFLPIMEREGFIRKHGAIWTHWSEKQKYEIRFREMPELGVKQNYTYHVDRSRFDELLLGHAISLGSRVMEGVRVESVAFSEDGFARGVRLKENGEQRVLRSKIVVDASGRGTLIGSQLKLKRTDPALNQFAIHNWFEGVDRGEGDLADFIHLHVLPQPNAWVWVIPINKSVTSVGIVTDAPGFVKGKETSEDFFTRQTATHPIFAQQMAKARPLHEYVREGNYSYAMERFIGDGWLMVGDSAMFVDPIFSSGVSMALESARQAAPLIANALARGNWSASSFGSHQERLRAALDIWHTLIDFYYKRPALFLRFIATEPQLQQQLTHLLQGDVFDRSNLPILEKMRREFDAAHSSAGQDSSGNAIL